MTSEGRLSAKTMSKDGHPSEKRRKPASGQASGRSDSGVGKKTAEYVGFVTHTPSQADARQYSAWCDNPSEMLEAANVLTASGFKLSLTYSEGTDSYVATLYRAKVGHADSGYGISSHAGEAFEAIRRACFTVAVLGGGGLGRWIDSVPGRREDPWEVKP